MGVCGVLTVSQGLCTLSWRRGEWVPQLRNAKSWCPPSSENESRANRCTSNARIKCTGVHSQETGPTPFPPLLLIKKILIVHRATSSVHHLFFIQVQHHALKALSLLRAPCRQDFSHQKSFTPSLWRLLSCPAAASVTLISHCGFLTMVSRTTISFHTWPWLRGTAEHCPQTAQGGGSGCPSPPSSRVNPSRCAGDSWWPCLGMSLTAGGCRVRCWGRKGTAQGRLSFAGIQVPFASATYTF